MFIDHKLDRQYYRALADCRQQPKLLELFQIRLEEVKEQLTKATDTQVIFRLQGQAYVLNEFLDAVQKSPEVIERLKVGA